jgi:hypothetical protein
MRGESMVGVASSQISDPAPRMATKIAIRQTRFDIPPSFSERNATAEENEPLRVLRKSLALIGSAEAGKKWSEGKKAQRRGTFDNGT